MTKPGWATGIGTSTAPTQCGELVQGTSLLPPASPEVGVELLEQLHFKQIEERHGPHERPAVVEVQQLKQEGGSGGRPLSKPVFWPGAAVNESVQSKRPERDTGHHNLDLERHLHLQLTIYNIQLATALEEIVRGEKHRRLQLLLKNLFLEKAS